MRAYLSRRQSLTCSSGFTLIETALIIVILGFIIAALIKTIPVLIVQEQERQQEKNYDTVRAALSAFISQDADGNPATPELMSRYPCPAPLNAGPADATFALEQRNAGTGECISSTDGSNGVFRIEDGGGNPIAYIGAIPTRTLEISSEYMLDPFKNKLTYAVSANMVMDNALGLGLNGMLNIEDDSGITFTLKTGPVPTASKAVRYCHVAQL